MNGMQNQMPNAGMGGMQGNMPGAGMAGIQNRGAQGMAAPTNGGFSQPAAPAAPAASSPPTAPTGATGAAGADDMMKDILAGLPLGGTPSPAVEATSPKSP